MILTDNLIDETILKAKCCLANFTVKYSTGLSLGKNDRCLLQKINLIDRYMCILDEFQLESNDPGKNCSKVTIVNCLTEDQIINIIKHINKLCKFCS